MAASTNEAINLALERQGTSRWQSMERVPSPLFRAFMLQFVCNLTGLQVLDFIHSDYGRSTYAIRLAVIQLHNQVERLRKLGVKVDVVFGDMDPPTTAGFSAGTAPSANDPTAPCASDPTAPYASDFTRAESSTGHDQLPLGVNPPGSSEAKSNPIKLYAQELEQSGNLDLRTAAKIYADIKARVVASFFMKDMPDDN